MVELVMYDSSGKNASKTTHKHDAKGNTIKVTTFKPKTTDGETRWVSTKEGVYEFTYWD